MSIFKRYRGNCDLKQLACSMKAVLGNSSALCVTDTSFVNVGELL